MCICHSSAHLLRRNPVISIGIQSLQTQIGHTNLPLLPKETYLVWKLLLCELCFIHQQKTMEFFCLQNVANVTIVLFCNSIRLVWYQRAYCIDIYVLLICPVCKDMITVQCACTDITLRRNHVTAQVCYALSTVKNHRYASLDRSYCISV